LESRKCVARANRVLPVLFRCFSESILPESSAHQSGITHTPDKKASVTASAPPVREQSHETPGADAAPLARNRLLSAGGHMAKKTIADIDVRGKAVLTRVDFNVPPDGAK